MKDDLPRGFRAATTGAAFKKEGRDDLGLILSDFPCVLAALFTRNLFRAAPVQIDEQILASGRTVRAVIANSGQANSCTGDEGLRNCHEIQDIAGELLHVPADEILLISTGVIGDQFDMTKWRKALPKLLDSLGKRDPEGFTRAFMTTDAFPKFISRTLDVSDGKVRIAVMAKGAGMICPNMATMLCVVLADALIERQAWQEIFKVCVENTFNRVSVDGDTSTNDTILGLANGASGVHIKYEKDLDALRSALYESLSLVSQMLVKDGEGAKRVIEIKVTGARNNEDAEKAARAVGNSQLVKTAIYGGDANWGRIINAVGYSGATIRPEDVCLTICGIERFRNGQPINSELEKELTARMQGGIIEIRLNLGKGEGAYELWASDLGHEYVTLNADYRS